MHVNVDVAKVGGVVDAPTTIVVFSYSVYSEDPKLALSAVIIPTSLV